MSGISGMRLGRRLVAAAMVMSLVTALAACGSSSSSSTSASSAGASTSSSGTTTASTSGKTTNIAYLLATEAAGYPLGMKAAAQAVASQYHANIQFFDAQFNPATQVAQCQDAITRGTFQAIVTLPAASPPMVVCARLAAQHHIPLIATNTPIGDNLGQIAPTVAGVTSQVLVPALTYFGGQPNQGSGQLLRSMCKQVKGTCRIAFIIGNPALALTTPAENAIHALAAKYGWQVVGTCAGNYQRQGGTTCMQDLLQKAPNLNVVMSLSDDMAQGATQVLEKAGKVPGKDVLIGTQGGSYEGVPLIRAGKWYGSIISPAKPEGAIPVQLAVAAAQGKTVPNAVDPLKAENLPLVFDQQNKDQYPTFQGYFHA
ncbi:MAG: sugar ABC transporter substrate-binding protein [Solirubrobacterales bacterium]|nr:sugar ABC transporter substrate-binding protein [Solirubrobacterales bacterium]